MFLEDWKQARKAFETATQKKKPCEKFLGLFNKSTGIHGSVKELDDALASGDNARMLKAEKVFDKVKGDYAPILVKAAKEDKTADYLKETQKLGDALDQIATDFGAACQDKKEAAADAAADKLIKLFDAVGKSAAPVQKEAAKAKRQAILDHGACSDALAAIVLAGGQADAPAVKEAYGVIAAKAKAIDAAIGVNTAALQKVQAEFKKVYDAFDKARGSLPRRRRFRRWGEALSSAPLPLPPRPARRLVEQARPYPGRGGNSCHSCASESADSGTRP
jgi:hypothetical protein